ncbi:hypothetical protein GCM10009854_15420 [Saccharopolyspora halophila]|uniref:Uncharacterized protein n=1 Tax=Saccharopolyspora halophila TaxID=405551 RepID=A0ABN3FYN7_9PSEU
MFPATNGDAVPSNPEALRDQPTADQAADPRDAGRVARERDQAVHELLELEHAATEGPQVPRQA